jgi:Fe(3+) dicitrate transport protein
MLIGPNERFFVSQGVQSVLDVESRHGAFSQRFQSGIRFHYDEIERRHSETGFALSGGQLLPEDRAPEVTAANEAKSYAMALHLADAISYGEFSLTPGVRAELIQSTVEDFSDARKTSGSVAALMPGLGAYVALFESFGVLAGVYRGFSPPPPGSGSDVKPEDSINYEAGMRFSSGRARVELIGFYSDYSNLTDVCTFASGCAADDLDRQFDAGKARIHGLEAYAAHDIPVARELKLPFSAAYTFTRAEFLTSFVSDDPIYGRVLAGDEMPYVPAHQLNVTFGAEHPRLRVSAAVNYVARMREQAGSAPLSDVLATDEQFVVDLAVRAPIVGGLSLYANAQNLFDAAYIVSRRPYGARPNPPRWIRAGAKLEF